MARPPWTSPRSWPWPELAITGAVSLLVALNFDSLESLLGAPGAYNVAIPDSVAYAARGAADVDQFADAGRALLGGDLGIYRDDWLQAGPLQFLLDAGVVGAFGASAATWVIARFLAIWAFSMATVALVRPSGSSRAIRAAGLVAGLFVILHGEAISFYRWGHWWQLPIYLAIAWAARLVDRDRVLWAAALIGVSAWLEPFAVMGLAVLVLAPAVRRGLLGLAAGLGIAALGYLPFLLSGEFAMGRKTWGIKDGTVASLVLGTSPDAQITWGVRVAQALACVLVVAAVAWIARRHLPWPAAAFAVAAGLGLVRIATDGYWLRYYWLVPFILVLAAALRLLWLRQPACLPLLLGVLVGILMAPAWGPAAAALTVLLIASVGWRGWTGAWRRLAPRADFAPADPAG